MPLLRRAHVWSPPYVGECQAVAEELQADRVLNGTVYIYG